MELDKNKKIIIALLVIIIVLAAAIGFVLLNPTHAKEPTKIKITSDKSQYEGGNISVKLTDLNGTAISKEIVNITITNNKGKVVVDDVVKTNSKGKADLKLDLKKGKYDVNVTYGGNENYTGNNTTQKLAIKEEEVVEPVQSSSSQSSSNQISYDSDINVYYDSNGVVVDPDGHHGQAVGESYSELRNEYEKWKRGEPVMM